MYFLGKMTVNKQSIEEIEAKRKSVKELDIELECCLLMERLISCLELEETTRKRSTVQNVKKGRKELDWTSCSVIVYFYLHPALGKKDLVRCAELFRISPCTLEGWVMKANMKKRWSLIVKNLKFDDVI